MPPLQYASVQTALHEASLDAIAPHMLALMVRNVATDGYPFEDPSRPGVFSKPGCVIASPSWPGNLPGATDQWYVHNWTRDAALTAIELTNCEDAEDQFFVDYVEFAATCQADAGDDLDHACYRVDGTKRPDWPRKQSDGPALQTLAILAMWGRLPGTAEAGSVVATNVRFLLSAYQKPTNTLWEERSGGSFFARSVQRRCFAAVRDNDAGIEVPDGIGDAIDWLDEALRAHWHDDEGFYRTLEPRSDGYDPNIDIVLAALYGSLPGTDVASRDPKLLATAAKLHAQWSQPGGHPDYTYRINGDDAARGIGPLFGRYPEDSYDGDTTDGGDTGHPWALCTCAFAELCYRVAADIAAGKAPTGHALATPFFEQLGGSAEALRDAGDRMLRAVVFHSDHLELSEQFDRTTGFEKSVRNLTWSYSSFLSAVRARAAVAGA